MANHFLDIFNREFRKEVKSVSADVIQTFEGWDWPGNVRELRNVMERALIFADGDTLTDNDLPNLGTMHIAVGESSQADGYQISKGLTLADAEKAYIRQTLEDCDGSVQRASEVLGISRKNLWEKRKKYGLLE